MVAWKKLARIVAHRGGAGLWPENSHLAFRRSLALDVDGAELDVHLTRDGQVAVIHDATLERTTRGKGLVSAHTAAELTAIAVDGADGEGVALLADVLPLFAGTTKVPSIELKSDAQGRSYPGLVLAVVELVDRFALRDRAFVHSFEWGYLEELKRLAPDIRRGANVEAATLAAKGGIERVLDEIATRAHDVNIDRRLVVDPSVIDGAHARGLSMTLWTVNDDTDLERFLLAGVDVVCTDRPDRALAIKSAIAAGRD